MCGNQGYICEVLTQGNTVVLRGACHRCGRARGVRVMDLDEEKGPKIDPGEGPLKDGSENKLWVKMRFELLP
jgi:hypothetical protein